MIQVEHLSRSFGDVRALDRVSFAVGRGEVVGLLGPNGAGKSTLQRILTGFALPDSGRATVAGLDVRSGSGEELEARRRIGYLPESTPLYGDMRVVDYLTFVARVRELSRAESSRALERVVQDCGLAGMTRRRIRQLSKGYRQRVGLAQALLPDPEVLILDEPTSGLDPLEMLRVRDLVVRLGREKTVLLSSHLLAEVREVCPRVVILAGGRVVGDGAPDDLAGSEAPVLRVALRAEAGAARALFDGLAGVSAVRERGASDGVARFELDLAPTPEGESSANASVEEEIARRAAARGIGLRELARELPGLEALFLRRVAPGARASESPPAAGAAEAERER
jgi:ABC-2 type transport system ATP-binding protein